jgi:hypothetical protein
MCLQLAAASYIYIQYAEKKEKNKKQWWWWWWWWQTQLYSSRVVYSASSLLADLNYQSVTGLYKNFTRMSPTEFEYLIHLIFYCSATDALGPIFASSYRHL